MKQSTPNVNTYAVTVEVVRRYTLLVPAPDADAAEAVAHGLSAAAVRVRADNQAAPAREVTRVVSVRETESSAARRQVQRG